MRSLLLALLVAPLAVADPPVAAPPPAPNPPPIPSLVPPVKDGKVTYTLDLSPAPTPAPLSAYYLEAEYGEKQPGDRLSGFLKCFMEQDTFFNQENQQKRLVWLGTPLADLPADVRKQAGVGNGLAYNPKYATLMVFADQAARYTRTEWNEYFNLRKDGIYFLLPEIQKLRAISHVVQLRMRGEVKAGEFDKAVVSARTLFGLARMMESHPTLISNLVALAIANQTVETLQEMVARPGCPNLYWSFADLPTPFLSVREGVAGERVFVTSQYVSKVPIDKAMTGAEVNAVIKDISDAVTVSEGKVPVLDLPTAKYAVLAGNAERMDAVRERLTKGGTPEGVVKAMPALQLALLDDLHRYEVTRDEMFKWMNRPHPEALTGLKDAESQLKAEKANGCVLIPLLMPATIKVKTSQTRLDQRLAYLMAIEAIRLHAHESGGKLPGKLSDVKVTVPADPVSGKAFSYSVTDGAATLTGANPSGMDTDNRVFELRVRK